MALAALAFVFAAGLTVCGIAGSLLQIATGTKLGFGPPFMRRERVAVSLATSVVAGPYMMLNDALMLRRVGRIGWRGVALFAALGTIWTMAVGVLAVEIMVLVAQL